MPRLIGPAMAKEMIFSGKTYTARECLDMGLVQKVIPEGGLVTEVAKKEAARYAAGPAVALAMAKKAIDRGMECSIGEGLVIEAHGICLCFATQDQEIGMRTFLEKGPGKALFTGS